MQNHVDAFAGFGGCRGIAEINPAKVDFSGQIIDVRFEAGREVVQPADRVSLGNKSMCEVRADESGDTGNEICSQVSIPMPLRAQKLVEFERRVEPKNSLSPISNTKVLLGNHKSPHR